MNKRRFLQIFGGVVSTIVALPLSTISYDPVKQKIIKPKIYYDGLEGFRGSSFLECGYIYAPYMVLYKTPDIVYTSSGQA